jgi:hypothetical protein
MNERSPFGGSSEPVVEWMKGNELQNRGVGGDLGGTMRLGDYPAAQQRLVARLSMQSPFSLDDLIAERIDGLALLERLRA